MICRVCLKPSEGFLNIFDATRKENIGHIIQQHFWFEPMPNDTVSTVICLDCWSNISVFHQFYMTVEQAHDILQLLVPKEISKEEDCEVDCFISEQLEDVEVIIKEELVENVWQVAAEEPPADTLVTNNPLYEPEVLHCGTTPAAGQKAYDKIQSVANVKSDSEVSSSLEEENVKMPKRETKVAACTPSLSKARKRSRKTKSVIAEEKVVASVTDDDKPHEKRQRRNMITQHDDEMIKKHIPMGCNLCAFVGEDFTEISKHFREDHNGMRGYVVCCGRKMNKRFLLLQHAYKHEDPEFFKCNVCLKIFSDGYVLRSHILATHAPEEDLKFPCDQCPRKFSRRYLLELHKPSHIPLNERKFICDKCTDVKAFASEHLLQIHTSMRHTKATNVCHVCAKEIRDNQAFAKHVRLHFEDSGPRVKCPRPDCDRWLKDMDNLKQHLRRHNDEGKVFTCDECDKVCKNRRSLTSHFNYAHTKTVFSCDDCHKTFKKAITLKEHMAQHTGETLYKCPFCTRTFNSNANMHSHKKRMHPVEWDIWRKTKRGSSQHILSSSTSNGLATDNSTFDNDTLVVDNLLQ